MAAHSAARLAVSKAARRVGWWVDRMAEMLDSRSGGSLAARWADSRADWWVSLTAVLMADLTGRMRADPMVAATAASWVFWRADLMACWWAVTMVGLMGGARAGWKAVRSADT